MKPFIKAVLELKDPDEFEKLKKIGGHKVFHLEGDAYYHTKMVYLAAQSLYPDDELLHRAALLHDIGKIYSSQCQGPNDWTYAGHSIAGARALNNFVDEDDPDFPILKRLIAEHIKPMFWEKKGVDANQVLFEYGKEFGILLCKLVLCDLNGSIPSERGVKASINASEYVKSILEQLCERLKGFGQLQCL